MKRYISSLFLLLLTSISGLYAMDIRSLDIGYEKVGSLSYRAKVTAYVFNSGPVDKTMRIAWGDGDTSLISLKDSSIVNNYLRKLEYSGKHTYSGAATYEISLEYFNRQAGATNVTSSANEAIYVSSKIIINPFLGTNSSPEFTLPPEDNACTNNPYIYNPGIVDAENDSIVVSKVQSKGKGGNVLLGYKYPDQYTVDPATGTIIWTDNQKKGRYYVTLLVEEYRNGILIGTSMRDMQISAGNCLNQAPDIFTFNDTCVVVGDLMNSPAYTLDNTGDTLTIRALGEIMDLKFNAGHFANPATGIDSAGDYFMWMPDCDLVRLPPYQVHFIADKKGAASSGYFPVTNDFNSGILGADWYATNQVVFTNPCNPSADGTTYLWMGDASAHPRWVVTQAYDLTNGSNEIHFDMKWSTQGYISPCEGPDLPDEGVHLQYSLQGVNGPWKEITYWDPSQPPPGGFNPMLTVWNHYSIPIPQSAISSNTRFRFLQTSSSGANYDHWGIDNFRIFDRPENLSATRAVEIKVIAPAPENLTANAVNQTIELSWNKSKCPNATGYKLYRKNSYYGYVPSSCETGVPAYTGYKHIATINGINDTTYIDDNKGQGIPQGFNHCYMVTAIFPDSAESYPSAEACAKIDRDKPLLTKVSVAATGASNGSIDLEWSKPPFIDNAYQGPYRYLIYRAVDTATNWQLIDSTASINDTTFFDDNLDTETNQYYYRIEFYQVDPSARILISESPHASSVFLNLVPGDESITLNMDYDVSWNNDSFVVYRQDPGATAFDSITTVYQPAYKDTGLTNGETYCYKVKSIGSYSAGNTINPLINYSQETCAKPRDIDAPCAPKLVVTVNCLDITNKLRWNNLLNTCAPDVAHYDIYYRPLKEGAFDLIHQTGLPDDTVFIHKNLSSIAGCYRIVAVDSSGNEGYPSNTVCVDIDSCDIYRLPNVFTPNGDGYNDTFIPYPYDFVERVDMTIYNRWGTVVYTTNDPDINWNGKHENSGRDCAEGVYYYVCDVYQRSLEGEEKITLTGSISLLR